MNRWLSVGLILGILALPALFAALAAGGVAVAALALFLVCAAGLVGATSDERVDCHRCSAANDPERAVCVECGEPL